MLQLRNRLQNRILNDREQALKLLAPILNNSVQSKKSIKNKAIDDKDRLSKPRSQIKGVELLRNPTQYKVN